MTTTLTTRFFDERWMQENRLDVIRAQELHLDAVMSEARRKLATMTREEFLADAAQNIREADRLLLGLFEEN